MSFVDDAPQGRGEGRGQTLLVLDRFAIAAMSLPGGEIWDWSRGLGREVTEEAKGLLIAGDHVDTGALLHSTDFSVIPSGVGLTQVNVRASSRHALWFILGTLPHVIVPKHLTTYEADPPKFSAEYYRGTRAGDTVLGWLYWFRDATHHFSREVHHPGWRGYNYLDDAKKFVLIRRGII